MAYDVDTRFVVTHPNRGTAEIAYDRVAVNKWRRWKRNSPEQKWGNWPNDPHLVAYTDDEVKEQLHRFIDNARID